MLFKKLNVLVFAIVGTVFMVGLFPAVSVSQPPAPVFLPGFPILAGGQVMMMWAPAPGVKEYKIYKNGTMVATSPATQYFDLLGEGASGEFRYQVSAVGLDGKEGAKSPEKVIKLLRLEIPKELIGRSLGKSVGLRWKSAEGVVAYNVYRAEDKDESSLYKLISSVTTDTYTDSNISFGKKYFYRISARDVSGKESPKTDPVKITLEEEKIAAETQKVFVRRTRTIQLFKDGLDIESGVKVDLRAPYDVAVGADRVFVTASGPARVVVFDKDKGRYLFEIGTGGKVEAGAKEGAFQRVAGVCLRPEGGQLYVVEVETRSIHVFTLDGVPVTVIQPEPPKAPEKPFRFFNLEVDKEGNVWLPDSANNRIRIYDVRGKEIRAFGKEEEVHQPGFIRIDWKGNRFYAINQHGNFLGVSVFDLDGKFQRRFGEKGMSGGKLWAPVGIDVMDDGSVIQADGINSIINVFDPATGKLRYHLRDEDVKKIVQIGSARGLQVEGQKVYVASSILNEVEVLEMFGEPVSE